MMNKKLIFVGLGLLVIALSFFLLRGSKEPELYITTTVDKGTFEVKVFTSGQLEAESSEKIVIPGELNQGNVRIYEIKITDLVEEGTVVQEGDYVASLDHKVVEEALVGARLELEQAMNDLEDSKMDSNLNLSNNRDLIINAREQVEQMQIILEESVYESPSIIRKAEMDLDKAKRNLEQEKLAYELRTQQAAARVYRRVVYMNQRESRVKELENVYSTLYIHAPKPGMVIYSKDRYGDKIKIGSTVSRWSPIIATLPDLSKMISVTWVNEIDVSKVKPGQPVTLGIDAFPDKELKGEVISVANIGQPMPRSDAKVFEVRVRVFGNDPDLRPAMTTSNVIQTGAFEEELFVATDAVFQSDSMNFVFLKKNGIIRQVVETGEENENFTIIKQGLQQGDEVLLTRPANFEDLPLSGIEIFEQIKQREAEATRSVADRESQAGLTPQTGSSERARMQPNRGQR